MVKNMLNKAQAAKIREKLLDGNKDRLLSIFNVLGDRGRFQIFRLLIKKHKALCVTELAEVLGVSVPAVSQQLKIMELTGVIKPERMGQKICYQLNETDKSVKDLVKIISS